LDEEATKQKQLVTDQGDKLQEDLEEQHNMLKSSCARSGRSG
jgi:hypothetical protein